MPRRHRRPLSVHVRTNRAIVIVALPVAVVIGGVAVARVLPPLATQAPAAPPAPSSPTAGSTPGTPPPVKTPPATTPARGEAPVSPHMTADRWRHVLSTIDAARSRAWREGTPRALLDVWTPTSTGLRKDRASLRAYTRRGLTVSGVSLGVQRIQVLHAGPEEAVLRTASATTRHQLRLVRTSQGWRLSEVSRR